MSLGVVQSGMLVGLKRAGRGLARSLSECALIGVLLVPLAVLWQAAKLGTPSVVERLQAAAQRGDVEAIESALDRGAAVDGRDSGGFTSLMIAARAGWPDAVEELLLRGADVNAKTAASGTALMQAALYGHEKVAKILLAYGADPNCRSEQGQTALGCALTSADLSGRMIASLLWWGADPAMQGCGGQTPLTAAVERGDGAIVQMLLEHGADPDALTGEQMSVRHLVRERYGSARAQLPARGGLRGSKEQKEPEYR